VYKVRARDRNTILEEFAFLASGMLGASIFSQRCVDELMATWRGRDRLRLSGICRPGDVSSPGLSRPAPLFNALLLPSFD
jgi:hypothetical protein